MEIIKEIIQVALQPVDALSSMIAGKESMSKGVVSLAIISFVLVLMRKLPRLVFETLMKNFTTSITFGSESFPDLVAQIEAFICEKKRIHTLRISRFRSGKLTTNSTPAQATIVPGLMRGYFFHKGKLILFTKEERVQTKERHGLVNDFHTSLTLVGFTKDRDFFKDLCEYDDFFKEKTQRIISEFEPNQHYLAFEKEITKQPKVFIDETIKRNIDVAINNFANKEWYEERALSHKLIIVLYGPPGTGKTSLTSYIAEKLNMSLATLEASAIDSKNLKKAVSLCSTANFVLSIQDFETNKGFLKRSDDLKEIRNRIFNEKELSISTVLNIFQGEVPLENSVVVFTTNHIELIDEAFLRKGRVDLLLEVGPLGFKQIEEFYQFYYKTEDHLPEFYSGYKIKATDLMNSFKENPYSKEDFLEAIKTLNYEPIKEKEITTNEIR